MVGHDENYALQFINGWNEQKVTINGITFQVNEEVISMATGLSPKGKKWKKVTKMVDEVSMKSFLEKAKSRSITEGASRGKSCQNHGMKFAW